MSSYSTPATHAMQGKVVGVCDPIAPGARGWDPASPARFIEWFLCRCITSSERHAPWRRAALPLAENYADLCTWLMHMCPCMALRPMCARDSLLGRLGTRERLQHARP